MASVNQMLQSGSYVNDVTGSRDFSYYDDMVIAAAVGTTTLFRNPIGVGGKTLADTNMVTAGILPSTQKLTVKAIKVFYATVDAFATVDLQAFYTMLRSTTFELQVSNKPVDIQLNLMELFGISLAAAFTPTVAGDNLPMILPRFHGIFPLNRPIVLQGNVQFEVRMSHWVAPGAGLVGDFLFISLNGDLDSSIG